MDFPQFLSPAETSAEKGARNAVIRLVLCVAAMRECNFARGRALKNIPKMFEIVVEAKSRWYDFIYQRR